MGMNLLKWTVLLFLLFLALDLVSAQEEPVYDYSSPDAYQQEGFYASSDPAQWDLSQVNWDKVDWTNPAIYQNPDIFSRAEPYQQDGFYQNLHKEGYSKLDYTKVNYDNANLNHDLIDAQKYVQDLGCASCEMSKYGGVSVKYSKTGVTHGNGDSVSIPGDYPSGTEFHLLTNSIFIFLPEGAAEIMVPAEDEVTIDTSTFETTSEGGVTIKTGKARKLQYQRNTINGRLSFKDGQPYLRRENEVTINGVLISNLELEELVSTDAANSAVNIYFDGERHPGSYVSMNLEQRKMSFGKGLGGIYSDADYELSFNPGNPFLDLEAEDSLIMTPGYGSEIIIQQREADLIPMVVVKKGGHGVDLMMRNGKQRYFVVDGSKFNYLGASSTFTGGSVSFTMLLQDEEGNNLLGTEKEREKIIFDNAQNQVILPESFSEKEFECVSCAADLSKSRVLFDSASARIYGSGIKGEITTDNAAALYQVSRILEQIPPDVRNSFSEVEIVPESEIEARCGEGTAGCADGSGKIIIGVSFTPNLFYHEAAHTLTFGIEQRETLEAEKQVKEFELELKRKYGTEQPISILRNPTTKVSCQFTECDLNNVEMATTIQGISPEEAGQLKSLLVSAEKGRVSSFAVRWKSVSGDVYGRELGEKVVQGRSAKVWEDGSDAPRNGCLRAYGCNNFYEDVATFVEPVADGNYDFYKPFITPGSGKYDPRYREKLDLLHEYHFINDEDYRKIIGR